MTLKKRILVIVMLEFLKLLEIIVSFFSGLLMLILLQPVNTTLAWISFAIVSLGFAALFYKSNRISFGINYWLDKYREPHNEWIKKTFS